MSLGIGNAGSAGPSSVGAVLDAAARRLAAAGVEAPRRDARILLAHGLDADAAFVVGHPEHRLDAARRGRIEALIGRRCRREPVARIVGGREFWSLAFKVGAETLVPRPDSECVVAAALAGLGPRPGAVRLLDLGTGSGCLLLALLDAWPEARGVGVDIASGALAVARDNAQAFGLAGRAAFVCADWGWGLAGGFDVIVANPPYVADAVLAGLAPEVAVWEPRRALAGGADGLDAMRRVIPRMRALVAPGGRVFMEIGAGQAPAAVAILRQSEFQVVEIKPDLSGIPRCVAAVQQDRAGRK